MAWTTKQGLEGPNALSSDGHARIFKFGQKFFLQVMSAPKGKRLDMFDSLTDAQDAYDTGDRSKGMKAKRVAG